MLVKVNQVGENSLFLQQTQVLVWQQDKEERNLQNLWQKYWPSDYANIPIPLAILTKDLMKDLSAPDEDEASKI